ncbi:MAG TPA: chorismate-binding protein, partial [Nocardioides sp.]
MSSPVEFFREVAAQHPRCFWLDGGGAREWSGRRSIIGWLEDDDVSLSWSAARREVVEHARGTATVVGDDVFAVLEERMRPGEQWFGYLGYASRTDLPAFPDPTLPDAVWMRPRAVRVFEHDPHSVVEVRAQRASRPRPSSKVAGLVAGAPRTSTTERGRVPEEYAAAFARVQEHLHAGNSYEVNLTHRLTRESDLDPVTAYLRLRELNPAPYSGFLQHDVDDARAWLLSSSPERYALVTPDRNLETKPIKGTTPRGATPEEDEALRVRLATDPKTRAENLMIVDLLRTDLSLVCDVGSVEVPALMQVESYESVHQLVSTVRGHLRDDVTTVA